MDRLTATFDEGLVREIRRVAGRRGVSAFLQVAAQERLIKLRLMALLDDLDRTYGPPSADELARVDADARELFRLDGPTLGQASVARKRSRRRHARQQPTPRRPAPRQPR